MRLPSATTHSLCSLLASCRGKHLSACPASILHFHSVSMDFLTTQLSWLLSATLRRYTSLVAEISDQTGIAFAVYNASWLCFALEATYLHRGVELLLPS